MRHLRLVFAASLLVFTCSCLAQSSSECVVGIAGIALEYDSTTKFSVTAGTAIRFNLVARDENLDIVEDWEKIGRDVVLTVRGSHAETDSSARSWDRRTRDFTWLHLQVNSTALTMDSLFTDSVEVLLYYAIPKSAFTNGRASLTFTQSGADDDIILSVQPRWSHLQQISPPITVLPGPHDNYLMTIASSTPEPDNVFRLRRYELLVAPRDRYTNIISDSTIHTAFSARFPDEFDLNRPDISDLLVGSHHVRGVTAFHIASRVRRMDSEGEVRQWIRAFDPRDSLVHGQTTPYQILDHAPNPFTLVEPTDDCFFYLLPSTEKRVFTWSRPSPPDPYTDIQISRFDSALSSDRITYKIRFMHARELQRAIVFEADNYGMDTTYTITQGALSGIMDQLAGYSWVRELDVMWYVTATDGLYITWATPPSNDSLGREGHLLRLRKPPPIGVSSPPHPEVSALHQNYPNPFNPSTTIEFELRRSGDVRVCVCNLLGEEVALLHDGFLEAGKHSIPFRGHNMNSGVYTYRLEMEGVSLTKRMLLLR